MEKQVFVFAHDQARRNAAQFCMTAPEGWMATFSEPTKKRIQEEKYHAMIADIANQSTYIGRKWDGKSMKRILVDEFDEEMRLAGTPLHGSGQVIPSENGRRVIQLGVQTRGFYVKEAAQFIEFLYAWGADRNVVWSEPKKVAA